MKSVFLSIVFCVFTIELFAQTNTLKLGVCTNISAISQFRYGLDFIANKENIKWQLLMGMNFINGTMNLNQKRNIPEYNADYMKKANDQLNGFGYNFQIRKLVFNKTYDPLSSKLLIFTSLNYNHQNNKVTYWQNDYEIRNGLYHYQLVKNKSDLKIQAIQSQIIFFQHGRKFFSELGLGLGYNFITQNEHLRQSRKYNKYLNDIGYGGLKPILSLRIGCYILH